MPTSRILDEINCNYKDLWKTGVHTSVQPKGST